MDENLQLFLHLSAAKIGSYETDGTSETLGDGYPATAIDPTLGIMITCTREPVPGSGPWTVNQPAQWLNTTFSGNIMAVGVIGPNNAGRFVYNLGYANGSNYWNGTAFAATTGPAKGIRVEQARMMDQKLDDGGSNSGVLGVIGGCVGYYTTLCTNYEGTNAGCTPTCATNPYVIMGKMIKL